MGHSKVAREVDALLSLRFANTRMAAPNPHRRMVAGRLHRLSAGEAIAYPALTGLACDAVF